jgi:hypothetical protein
MKKILISAFTIFAAVTAVAGATAAVFSDTERIAGNTIGAAVVDISLVPNAQETLQKPIAAGNLVPGEMSDWYYINVDNDGTVESNVFMRTENFDGTGKICANTNLQVEANSGSGWYNKYDGTVFLAAAPPIQLKVAPLADGETLQVRQRVQLDENAPDSAQGETCTWDEVFTAENVVPTP